MDDVVVVVVVCCMVAGPRNLYPYAHVRCLSWFAEMAVDGIDQRVCFERLSLLFVVFQFWLTLFFLSFSFFSRTSDVTIVADLALKYNCLYCSS